MGSSVININESSAQQLGENLRSLLKSNNLSINQAAQALGIPMMTIRRLISGETTDPRISTLKLVADYFNVTVDSLTEDNNQTFLKASRKTKPYFVPILDWHTVEKINSINDLDLHKWKEWQPVTLNNQDTISKNTFALESRPSMYPRFPQGAIFIIDPDITPTDGDIVLVKIKSNNELTLRELVIDPPEWKLQPIVSGSNALQYSENNYEIVGINILTMLYNRRAYGQESKYVDGENSSKEHVRTNIY